MQFEGGATVNFTMVAFTEKLCDRQTKVYGTKVQNFQLLYYFLSVLYCIVLYINFLKWPKYKPQGPLDINILLSRKR